MWVDGYPSRFTLYLPDGSSLDLSLASPAPGVLYYLQPSWISQHGANRGGAQIWAEVVSGQLKVYMGPETLVFAAVRPAGKPAYYAIDRILRTYSNIAKYVFERDAATGRLQAVVNYLGERVNVVMGDGVHVTQATAPDGSLWKYDYVAATGMLSSVSVLPAGASAWVQAATYAYDDARDPRLLTYSMPGGSYSYDAQGRVIRSINDSFAYGDTWTDYTNESGNTTRYTYAITNGSKQLVRTDYQGVPPACPAATIAQTYNAGQIASSTDAAGVVTTYQFNADGTLAQKTVAPGTALQQTFRFGYIVDEYGPRLSGQTTLNASGQVIQDTSFAYDSGSGAAVPRLLSITYKDTLTGGADRQVFYTYALYPSGFAKTLTTQVAGPAGWATTVAEYDEKGRLLRLTNPMGHVTTYGAYTGAGLPGWVTDANGATVNISYDHRGQVTYQAVANIGWSSNGYDPAGRLSSTNSSTGARYSYQYTDTDKLSSVTDGLGDAITFSMVANERHTLSRRETAQYVDGSVSTKPFDRAELEAAFIQEYGANIPPPYLPMVVAGLSNDYLIGRYGSFRSNSWVDGEAERPILVVGENGQRTSFTYDGTRNLKSITTADGRSTTFDYDALGRLTSQRLPDGSTSVSSYDTAGRLASFTDPRGLVTSYQYNGFGQVTRQVSPDTGVTTFGYGAGGYLASTTYADGRQLMLGRDIAGRVISRTAGSQTETLSYDEGAYGKGRLTTAAGTGGSVRFAYEVGGRLSSQTVLAQGQSLTVGWTYDSTGNLTGMNYPDGQSLSFQYDAYGRLSKVLGNAGSGGFVVADSMLYQPATAQRYAWRFGNGLPHIATLDRDGRLAALNGGSAHGLQFTYTPNLDTIAGITDTVYGSSQSSSLGYDAQDRLNSVVRSG
ncbi:MAG TPA: hypothetical protein VK305_05905, partial [Roseateles sp.]|nr:hypothetical protein [Roseateles sp.]